jgi:hypothetical protein
MSTDTTWRPSAKVEQCNACGSRRRSERDKVRDKVRGRDVLVTCTASWHDEPEPRRVTLWCAPCAGPRDVVDEFDDQAGVEEQARDVHVRSLDCGHDEVTPIRRNATGRCPHAAADECDCAPVIP